MRELYNNFNSELLPYEYILPEDRIPPVHNQHSGTSDNRCAAYAMSGIMTSMAVKYFGEPLEFSEGYIYGKYRAETDRTGNGGMFESQIFPAICEGGACLFEDMPDIKDRTEAFDYVRSHPELDAKAKKYAEMFEGCINLKANRKVKTAENIKKALFITLNPVFCSASLLYNHAIIICGWKGEQLLYRDCDGTKHLKLLNYKDIKEAYGFIMAEKETKKFIDVPDSHWGKDAINYCTEKGYMNGTGEDLFAPDKALTRAEIAQILYNYDKAVGRI